MDVHVHMYIRINVNLVKEGSFRMNMTLVNSGKGRVKQI